MPDGLRVGVDVGGTNTDAALVGVGGELLTWVKVPTTPDPGVGISEALTALNAPVEGVELVALGTTHPLNAIVQRTGLVRVAVVRIGSPGTDAIPPLAGWPDDLASAVAATVVNVRGGVEVDGRTLDVDRTELRRALERARGEIRGVAITGTFSPLDASQEQEAADVVADVFGPEMTVTLGSEVGGLGLLERENAAALNAALGGIAASIVASFVDEVARRIPGARPYLTQNDGTLMRPERAVELPIMTIGSGPSNSLRGAAALTGLSDVLVADVGGTSTDVGALVSGFPRESAVGVEIGGVRTNFRMPDVVSVALGGGTIVGDHGELGTESVGNRLIHDALIFGGSTPTLSDAGVAAGRATFGDVDAVRDRADLIRALDEAGLRLADAIDRVRTSSDDVDVILVGGGAVLLADGSDEEGMKVHRPEHAEVANAVGAALAPVSGEVDRVADVGGERRPEAIEANLEEARRRAVSAGADPNTLETIWVDEVPLAYLDRPMSRIRAKVAGSPRLGT